MSAAVISNTTNTFLVDEFEEFTEILARHWPNIMVVKEETDFAQHDNGYQNVRLYSEDGRWPGVDENYPDGFDGTFYDHLSHYVLEPDIVVFHQATIAGPGKITFESHSMRVGAIGDEIWLITSSLSEVEDLHRTMAKMATPRGTTHD